MVWLHRADALTMCSGILYNITEQQSSRSFFIFQIRILNPALD